MEQMDMAMAKLRELSREMLGLSHAVFLYSVASLLHALGLRIKGL